MSDEREVRWASVLQEAAAEARRMFMEKAPPEFRDEDWPEVPRGLHQHGFISGVTFTLEYLSESEQSLEQLRTRLLEEWEAYRERDLDDFLDELE